MIQRIKFYGSIWWMSGLLFLNWLFDVLTHGSTLLIFIVSAALGATIWFNWQATKLRREVLLLKTRMALRGITVKDR